MPKVKSFLRAWLAIAVLMALAPAAPARAEGPPLDQFQVARPGLVLFEPRARAAVLSAMDPATLALFCGPEREEWPSHKAVTKIRTPTGDDGDQTDVRSEPFAWTVMNAAAAAYGRADAEARDALIGLLRRWADGEALTKIQDLHDNSYYSLERTLLPTIVAWSLVRDDPALEREDRALIGRWLNRLVRLRGVKRPPESRGEITELNNHRYLSGSVAMAWGALRGDHGLFQEGIRAYRIALRQMRSDGSLPLETARGTRALYYQRHAIASLVTIAEMAAVQGYDLYSESFGGRRLKDAVAFLERGIADPAAVWPYAAANQRPGELQNYKVQDLTFMGRRGHGRHYMAWLEIWRARFPGDPAAARLWRALATFDAQPRPMVDEYSGGNTTCWFAAPPGSALVPARHRE